VRREKRRTMESPALAELERTGADGTPGEKPLLLEGLRVLVVDDDREAREAITAVLEEEGAVVTAVASAGAGLKEIGRRMPDVLVSDIAMPGTDGHMFIRRVRALDSARGGGTPAAAVTAYATAADQTRALLSGYQTYLPKPFEPDELVAMVARLARRT